MLDLLRERLEETEKTAARIHAPDWLVRELNTPKMRLEVQFRARVNGNLELFSGFVVLHRNPHPTGSCPYKGGLRFHPQVTIDLLTVLAMEMTDKCVLAGLPFGGGKSGLAFNPASYSEEDRRAITEAFTRELLKHNLPHPDIYVPGPDMGTGSREMFWMYNTVAEMNQVRNIPNAPASVTGKPVDENGIPEREDATARGALIQIRKFLELSGQKFSERPRLAIQGFGNVGANLARLGSEKGFDFNCIAVSDIVAGVYNPRGLHVSALFEWYQKHRTFEGFPGAEKISNADLLELPTDILLPAATENQITSANADKVKASVVFEIANRAITSAAEEILSAKKISVMPGIIANAGGVVVSFCEWSINRGTRIHESDLSSTEKNVVLVRLQKIMETTLKRAHRYATLKNCSFSCAAQDLAMLKMWELLQRKHSYPS